LLVEELDKLANAHIGARAISCVVLPAQVLTIKIESAIGYFGVLVAFDRAIARGVPRTIT
jgi:hypothetical protein